MADEQVVPESSAKIASARRSIADRQTRQAMEAAHAHTFNRVTMLVVGTFCGTIVLVTVGTMVAVCLKLVLWKDGFANISDLLKIVLLPVTTLALGHYIGRHR